MSESLEQALARFGFTVESMGGNCTAFVRMNGTAEEIIGLKDECLAPTSLLDNCALVVDTPYGKRTFYLSAFDIVANLEATDGAYPQNKSDR